MQKHHIMGQKVNQTLTISSIFVALSHQYILFRNVKMSVLF